MTSKPVVGTLIALGDAIAIEGCTSMRIGSTPQLKLFGEEELAK